MISREFTEKLRQASFQPGLLCFFISHCFIIRRGLYTAIRKLAPQITGDVLDFGCGSKPYLPLFGHVKSYIGTDIQVSGHDHYGSKIDVFYDGHTLPFPDKSFDSVVSFEVIEHVFNTEEVLKEIDRVLKPGGRLLVSIPFAWMEHEVPYDFARYTSFGITDILKKRGFRVIELTKTTTYVLALSQLMINYLTNPVKPRFRYLNYVLKLALISPLNALAYTADFILPKRYDYYCNLVILAEKEVAA